MPLNLTCKLPLANAVNCQGRPRWPSNSDFVFDGAARCRKVARWQPDHPVTADATTDTGGSRCRLRWALCPLMRHHTSLVFRTAVAERQRLPVTSTAAPGSSCLTRRATPSSDQDAVAGRNDIQSIHIPSHR